ncbi:MAG: hypothetical protein IJ143_09965 [Neisseriaceae bacterium]|nr:hypothetical protein [Neisseriaceae bacterium]
MIRRTFAEILASANIDISEEYEKLYTLFYNSGNYDSRKNNYGTLYQNVNKYFKYFPNNIRKNCLDLEEFDKKFEEFYFPEYHCDDINIFIIFCEYLTNILKCQKDILENIIKNKKQQKLRIDEEQYFCGNISIINNQITYAIEQMCYMPIEKDNITFFIPKSPEAIAVAESNIIPDSLTAYEILKYYHHSLKGNIEEKGQILDKLHKKILEPQRKKLSIENDLFYLLNNLNIRHNNITKDDKKYKQCIAKMSDEELEEWYDITYHMCLLAILELEYKDEYKTKINYLKQQP